jgi:hypothetical protein
MMGGGAMNFRTDWTVGFLLCIVVQTTGLAVAAPGFVENRGQVDARVCYYLQGPSVTVYATAEALVFDLREPIRDDASENGRRPAPDMAPWENDAEPAARIGCAVYLRFVGANRAPRLEARGELPGRSNYFLGNDPALWRTDVPSYAEVIYRDIWPNVDLVFRYRDGELTYAAVATDCVTATVVSFLYEGAEAVVRQRDAEVSLESAAGRLVEVRRSATEGAFLLGGQGQAKGDAQGGKNIPEALLWSTYIGGSSEDIGYAIALDASGNPVLTGSTYSPNFPATPGAYDISYSDYRDVFVAKLSSTGSELLWCTYMGGTNFDYGFALVLDTSENPVLTGYTRSSNFPSTPGAYDPTFNGSSNENAFVAKISSTGSKLLWSTFLGRYSNGYGLVLDPYENPIVTGMTSYSDFPTTAGAYDTSHNGGRDVFVAKLSGMGSVLLWSTFLGGSTDDWGLALALDASGCPVLAGYTWSSNFTTTPGAYDQTWNGGNTDAFVAKFSSTGSELLWSTYLGGNATDDGLALALDAAGNIVVTGRTGSHNFPVTPGAYDTDLLDGYEVFVSKISSTGADLLWSTFLGGSSGEAGNAVVLDSSDNPVVAGYTNSSNFPTTPDAYDTSYNVSDDVFLARLSSTGSELLYSTFLGGNSIEECNALVLDGSGKAVVAGRTYSANFPTTTGAYDTSHNGNYDALVARLSIGVAATSVADPDAAGVSVFLPSMPNPFRGRAVIRYNLARETDVDLGIYDVRGRLVKTLAAGRRSAGTHGEAWDGRDAFGRRAATGTYLVRLQTGGQQFQKRITMLR